MQLMSVRAERVRRGRRRYAHEDGKRGHVGRVELKSDVDSEDVPYHTICRILGIV